MDSNIKTIYIELLEEGTFVLRPTQGQQLAHLKFLILPTDDYDPELERWQFVPGTIVDCEWEVHDGETIIVAKRSAK